jgi:DNA-binding MarR family transcriptional regulator
METSAGSEITANKEDADAIRFRLNRIESKDRESPDEKGRDATMTARTTRTLDLQNSVGVLLNFLSTRLTASGSATYRSRFGLGILEFRLLVMLAAEPDIPPSRICEVMGLDGGAVSRALRGMEARALVASRPDRRNPAYKLWSLTAEGARLQDAAVPISMERDAILLAGFSDEERTMLIAMLRRMLAQVDGLRDLIDQP